MLLKLALKVAIAALLSIPVKGERPIELPEYIPPRAAEHLRSVSKANVLKALKDEANRFMEEQMITKLLIELEKRQNDSSCLRSSLTAVQDFRLGKSYARKMRDAMGREESGLYRGNIMWLGRYHECKAAVGPTVKPRLCNIILSDVENSTSGLYIGLCLPDVCEASELQELFRGMISTNATFATFQCPSDLELDAVDITAIVLYSTLAALVLGGSVCEVVISKKAKKTVDGHWDETQLPASMRVALAFSAIRNTKALFNTDRKEGNLDVLDGIRFISMAWIVLGHNLSFMLGLTDNVYDMMDFYIEHGSFQAIANGTFSVDTFFFLSGLLVAYLGMREMERTQGKLNIPLMYLNRYLRLTPCMAAVMLFAVSLAENVGEGPLFYTLVDKYLKAPCQKYWWTNLLYINNLYPEDLGDECIGWVWYLANDVQFYLLSPLFVFLFYKSAKAAILVVSTVVIISAAIVGGLSTIYEILPDVVHVGYSFNYFCSANIFTGEPQTTAEPYQYPAYNSYWDDIYAKPWCRIGVYVIGMATGYIIHVTKKNVKINKVFALVMWIIVLATGLAIVYCFCGSIYGFYFPSLEIMYFYNAVSRPLWGLCMAWITIACVAGYGGPINTFLSWRAFVPLSRLTFCAYLIHPIVISYMQSSREIEIHFGVAIFIYYYLAAMTLSYSLAYIISMMLEAPTVGIMKIIFPKRPGSAQPHLDGNVIANHKFEGIEDSDQYYVDDLNKKKEMLQNNVLECDRL